MLDMTPMDHMISVTRTTAGTSLAFLENDLHQERNAFVRLKTYLPSYELREGYEKCVLFLIFAYLSKMVKGVNIMFFRFSESATA
jgi:hypothetical protein